MHGINVQCKEEGDKTENQAPEKTINVITLYKKDDLAEYFFLLLLWFTGKTGPDLQHWK